MLFAYSLLSTYSNLSISQRHGPENSLQYDKVHFQHTFIIIRFDFKHVCSTMLLTAPKVNSILIR